MMDFAEQTRSALYNIVFLESSRKLNLTLHKGLIYGDDDSPRN